jgi:hypothetical protein|tara:strand:- start:364 stop:747 length:384 start_codon:yes stop_codon:yes gene_type:complete
MLINTPISLGELVDKISILMIKKKNISDSIKLQHVNKELEFLQKTLKKYISEDEINDFLLKLVNINSKLWDIEDDIRECERKKLFDQTFIDLARSVYFTNDERAKVKNDINKTFGSELVEVKSYEEY